MATFRRVLTPGGTYFFTANTYRRQRILTEPRAYTALKMAIQQVKSLRDCLLESVTDSRAKRRKLGLWQRRFWEHQIRDEGDLMRHVDYIHFNPVKHGYVQRVVGWPHSTFHRYVRHGVYPNDWAGDGFDMEHDFGEQRVGWVERSVTHQMMPNKHAEKL